VQAEQVEPQVLVDQMVMLAYLILFLLLVAVVVVGYNQLVEMVYQEVLAAAQVV
jgi:hypothetical protein